MTSQSLVKICFKIKQKKKTVRAEMRFGERKTYSGVYVFWKQLRIYWNTLSIRRKRTLEKGAIGPGLDSPTGGARLSGSSSFSRAQGGRARGELRRRFPAAQATVWRALDMGVIRRKDHIHSRWLGRGEGTGGSEPSSMAEGASGPIGGSGYAGSRSSLRGWAVRQVRGEADGGDGDTREALVTANSTGTWWRPKLLELGRTAASGRIEARAACFGVEEAYGGTLRLRGAYIGEGRSVPVGGVDKDGGNRQLRRQ
jgi:hypothetical protein